MRELNYQPNTLAWSLQGKQTKMIGVIMPSITNPFFAELVAAIEDKLEADGYKMLLCDAGQDSDKERRYLRMLGPTRSTGSSRVRTTWGLKNTSAMACRSFPLTGTCLTRCRS